MKRKILSLVFAALMLMAVSVYGYEICTTENIHCYTVAGPNTLQHAGSHTVMACGDTWAEWADNLDDWSEILCGHGAWGIM